MEDLLKVTNIVVGIAQNLNTQDYLSFQQVNKSVYQHHLCGSKDEKMWCQRLVAMELKSNRNDVPNDVKLECYDALTIFDHVKAFTPSTAKNTFIRFYKCFQGFTNKLYYNDLANFFPERYSDPLTQAIILQNISRYNKCCINDFTFYRRLQDNLRILQELFITTILKEMEKNFESRNFETVSKFIKVLLVCHEENTAVDFFKSKNDFMSEVQLPASIFNPDTNELDQRILKGALNTLTNFLNEKIKLVDKLFGDSYPVIINYSESLIADNLSEYFNSQLNDKKDSETDITRIDSMPVLYTSLIDLFVANLTESQNGGQNYAKVVTEFINLYFEPKIVSYLDVALQKFNEDTAAKFLKFLDDTKIRQKEHNEQIYKSLRDKVSNQQLINEKNDFLTSFTKMFKISNSTKTESKEQLKLAYDLNLMTSNLMSIESLVSLDLCYKVVEQCRNCIERMCTFLAIDNIIDTVKSKCQQAFKILIFQLSENHLKPGFTKAIEILQEYNPNEIKNLQIELEGLDSQVEPLVKFTELINTGDIVLQMTSIFYKNELIQKHIIDKNKDFLNDIVQTKKNFETMLDDYVAEGLNTGINKLMDEVLFVFSTLQLPDDFNPDPKTLRKREIKPSKAAMKNVELLYNHCFLLTGATDKGTIDVFQQEVGERFFNEIVKNIKKNLISADGAIFLICDLNFYYDFIANKLKQKSIVPLFAGLKAVGQLYLVSSKDSKELGKMICDVGRFQGIFTQEEIYELVQRRTDWVRVRRDVEKVIYGLGVSDCTIL
ncbi:LAFE_0G03400g1_1 [Lachancea fermentati]|uniref:LAFE_0G03400g1_1 n=1 Tax=Lachancea fermentati TaxID=4955 RepID=A0A1G4MH10_LACFM|nr:LAFE_0G03400g1_1 [Lachancea fermentati]